MFWVIKPSQVSHATALTIDWCGHPAIPPTWRILKESRVIQITVAFLQQEAGTGGGTKHWWDQGHFVHVYCLYCFTDKLRSCLFFVVHFIHAVAWIPTTNNTNWNLYPKCMYNCLSDASLGSTPTDPHRASSAHQFRRRPPPARSMAQKCPAGGLSKASQGSWGEYQACKNSKGLLNLGHFWKDTLTKRPFIAIFKMGTSHCHVCTC